MVNKQVTDMPASIRDRWRAYLATRGAERKGGYPAGHKTAAEMQPPPSNICRPRQKG